MNKNTEDLRIVEIRDVITPAQLHESVPITERATETIGQARKEIHKILSGDDDRLIMIVGPCSIHDPEAAREYAQRLLELRHSLADDLLIIMRVYFEKPRTIVGWKGLINDPNLDDSFEINKGLKLARELLNDINDSGMATGTEFLDLITPQYLADMISWGAIGARTTESQLHRELASGVSCPIGFKNGTDGGLQIAIDAVRAANRPHNFLSMTMEGHSAIFSTSGNEDCHIILRGGKQPNYRRQNVNETAKQLRAVDLKPNIMIDLSHANSAKDYKRQLLVGEDVVQQLRDGDQTIIGIMIESHLKEGQQKVKPGEPLVYGQSITDACIGWEETGPLLELFASAVRTRRSVKF
jgi:3-deoxy-7-phosphoheptulonate synthase